MSLTEKENIHKNHRKRVKERMERTGLSDWAAHEILELLLFYGIRQGDTNPIAHRLLQQFGSVAGILDASKDRLCTVHGVGPETANLIKVVAEVVKRYYQDEITQQKKLTLNSFDLIGRYCCSLFIGLEEEHLYMLSFNERGTMISCDLISKGGPGELFTNYREMMKMVLKHNASSVILTHNHPGGNPEPSAEDLEETRRIYEYLKNCGVCLREHFVVSHGAYRALIQLRM